MAAESSPIRNGLLECGAPKGLANVLREGNFVLLLQSPEPGIIELRGSRSFGQDVVRRQAGRGFLEAS
jgi:hypothetical protein